MRQACNVAFAIQVEQMDEKEFRDFMRGLDRDPDLGPLSRGTGDLMRLMGPQQQQGRGGKP